DVYGEERALSLRALGDRERERSVRPGRRRGERLGLLLLPRLAAGRVERRLEGDGRDGDARRGNVGEEEATLQLAGVRRAGEKRSDEDASGSGKTQGETSGNALIGRASHPRFRRPARAKVALERTRPRRRVP